MEWVLNQLKHTGHTWIVGNAQTCHHQANNQRCEYRDKPPCVLYELIPDCAAKFMGLTFRIQRQTSPPEYPNYAMVPETRAIHSIDASRRIAYLL